jgi:hypothetical protein
MGEAHARSIVANVGSFADRWLTSRHPLNVSRHDRICLFIGQEQVRAGRLLKQQIKPGRGMSLKGPDRPKDPALARIAVIEQWICFVLGLVCVAFGIWGVRMEWSQKTLSAHVAWLGSAYGPTLRVAAVMCVGIGVALLYRAWTQQGGTP